jgi:glycosyltransferase involved in cell wall biosynthesis
MYRDKKVGLVIPCRNEERLLPPTLESVPEQVDRVWVVDDCSSDRTPEVTEERRRVDPRVELIRHQENRGPGAAIVSGYRAAEADGCDLVVVVGGDNQMDLAELPKFLDPLVDGVADYAKGNRFLVYDETLEKMPRLRFVGNMIISALTKIASGYFKVVDVVDGYTVITRETLGRVNWERAWQGYGYPMDFLVRLNAAGARVIDVPRRPIYLEGERQSQIKGLSYALKVSPMLLRGFFWRLFFKYAIYDFHPLLFFYLMGLILLPLGLVFGGYLVYSQWIGHGVSGPRAVLCALLLITGLQSLIFGMLFDMEVSERR